MDFFKITNHDLCYLNDAMSTVFTDVKQEALNKQANTALIASLRYLFATNWQPNFSSLKNELLIKWMIILEKL